MDYEGHPRYSIGTVALYLCFQRIGTVSLFSFHEFGERIFRLDCKSGFFIIIILEKGISLKYFFQTFSDFLRLLEKKSDFFRLNLVFQTFQTFSDSVAALLELTFPRGLECL